MIWHAGQGGSIGSILPGFVLNEAPLVLFGPQSTWSMSGVIGRHAFMMKLGVFIEFPGDASAPGRRKC
ncbi:MAG: hypothetical protein EA381_15330 [Planctomycetaceae bacterium]|nr:MAG: hypothetical protein EA381_15330 [Planctomycetaceae bacterium]